MKWVTPLVGIKLYFARNNEARRQNERITAEIYPITPLIRYVEGAATDILSGIAPKDPPVFDILGSHKTKRL